MSQPSDAGSALRQRAVSLAFIVPPVVIALVIGEWGIALLVALLVVLAGVELFRLLQLSGYQVLSLLGIVAAVAIVAEAAAPVDLPSGDVLMIAIATILIAVAAFAQPEPRDGFSAWAATTFGVVYVSLLAFVIRLGDLAPPLPPDAVAAPIGPDRAWTLLLLFGVWSFDTGAYLIGRSFGRRRFVPHISPKKSIEGVIGGLVACTLVMAAGLWLLGESPLGALLLGPVLGLAGQAGDLAKSMLKRTAGVKDSGTILPGHGGILDRIDSFLFAAPVMTLYVVALVR